MFKNFDEVRKKRILDAIGKMIYLDFRPFSIVEDEGFTDLMRTLEPRFSIPCRTTFSRSIIPDIYQKARLNLE